jgi:two-component system response regulator ChvI
MEEDSNTTVERKPSDRRTIALVDDDRNILTTVSIALQADGFATRVYSDGEAALKAITENPPDLGVFDIKMPRMDGMELLRRVRAEHPALPIIFLTSKDDEEDEEAGFELGADDYIAKPFSLRLLIARIRAIMKRAGMPDENDSESAAPEPGPVIERGRLRMDPARHQVTWEERPVSLTVTEFLILEALAQRPGVIKSRNQLMDAAYPDDVFVDDRTVDSHIKRMRRKFRSVDRDFGAIETLYGAGYSFADG